MLELRPESVWVYCQVRKKAPLRSHLLMLCHPTSPVPSYQAVNIN